MIKAEKVKCEQCEGEVHRVKSHLKPSGAEKPDSGRVLHAYDCPHRHE